MNQIINVIETQTLTTYTYGKNFQSTQKLNLLSKKKIIIIKKPEDNLITYFSAVNFKNKKI
jgi:hypothetical protein